MNSIMSAIRLTNKTQMSGLVTVPDRPLQLGLYLGESMTRIAIATVFAGSLLTAVSHAGPIDYTAFKAKVGMEDLSGPCIQSPFQTGPSGFASDCDYQDVMADTEGGLYHLTGDYVFGGYQLPYVGEHPFPNGQFADYATAVGSQFSATMLAGQSALTNTLTVYNINSSQFITLASVGQHLSLDTRPGDFLLFFISSSLLPGFPVSTTFSSQAQWNTDHMPHMAVTDIQEPMHTPEPASMGLIGAALVMFGVWKRRRA